MKKVKITVLKITLDKELAQEYGAEGLRTCPVLKAGQVFYADYAKPAGFCDEEWKAPFTNTFFALTHGAGNGLFLLWGLDSKAARRSHLQLQRRFTPRYF